MIKAAFFDVDGTLLSHRTKGVPESARKALDALKAAGIKCVVSTGRTIREMEKLPLGGITFDAYITMNGQLTLDAEHRELYGMKLEGEVKDFALNLFGEKSYPVILIEKDRLYVNLANERLAEVQASISSGIPPVEAYAGADLYQACVYITEDEEEILKPIADRCEICRWHPGGVDVMAKGGGKKTAIRRLLEMENIRPEETIAFGDGQNDIGMLELAGIGVAMGNAVESLKRIADYITDDIDADGIEKALKHFDLI